MKRIEEQRNVHWDIPVSISQKDQILKALESGQVVYFPDLTIAVEKHDWAHLSERLLQPGVKNMSYDIREDKIKGISTQVGHESVLLNFMRQFANQTTAFVHQLLPHYRNSLEVGRTSYRPAEILNRVAPSKRKDDTLLHVDAFPSTPTSGKRILRLFVNINPHGKERLWRLGEPMSVVLKKFTPTLKNPLLPIAPKLMEILGITRSYRTLYDHYMLQLHDNMKMDDQYQQEADQIQFGFPSNSAWMVFTDVVSHAALSGQYLLEQTFYLPVEAMENPEFSPLVLLYKAGMKDLLPQVSELPIEEI